MEHKRANLAWTFFGLGVLALTLAVMTRSSGNPRLDVPGDLRDAAASPAASPMLGGVSVKQPNTWGAFASPAARRAEAEIVLMSSRNRRRELARSLAAQ